MSTLQSKECTSVLADGGQLRFLFTTHYLTIRVTNFKATH